MMEAVVNGAAALDGQQRMYSTHLKKVLKTYQLTAQRSLKGPAGVSAAAAASASKEEAAKDCCSGPSKDSSPPPSTASAMPTAAAPPPVFYTQDRPKNSELLVTELRTARISCFSVGGELRLCLPQVFNLVLNGFQPTDIYAQCDELHIHCSRCNQEQLDVLKCTKKLPDTAVSCGLITQTDAERLCGALLNTKARGAPSGKMLAAKSMAVRVYHECFGKCFGLLTPSFFYGDSSMCVECETCNYLFSPQNFVTHVHRRPENRTCHWGFNSSNWRAYLLLDEDQENADQYQEVLKELKQRRVEKFDKPHKRKQVSPFFFWDRCAPSDIPEILMWVSYAPSHPTTLVLMGKIRPY
jgi:SKI/SNO/DAC family/c-SKI Smad4 binding domain